MSSIFAQYNAIFIFFEGIQGNNLIPINWRLSNMKITNNTLEFIEIVNRVLDENKEYFLFLEEVKSNSIQKLKVQVLSDSGVSYENKYLDLNKVFIDHIKDFIKKRKDISFMNVSVLKGVSNQLEVDYFLKIFSKDEVYLYYSISNALIYYGIYRADQILSFQNVEFWKVLVKKLYLLGMMNAKQFHMFLEDDYPKHPDFNQLKVLVEAKKNIEEKLGEDVGFIDGVVVFKKGQEEKIVRKIEMKLSKMNLFNFLRYMFGIYQSNKIEHKVELTIPYKYIVNLLIKNISNSNHKRNDSKKVDNAIFLLNSFVSLYQLRESKFENVNVSERSLVEYLKKQVLYSNFYPIYSVKTNTLIEYVEYIVKPSVKEKLFFDEFGFSFDDVVKFFMVLDSKVDDVVVFNKGGIFNNDLRILEFFSIHAGQVNKNYSTISNLPNNINLFAMNPIVKYKNKFYVIGFKYFKMNFYNVIVERIRKNLDKDINREIGSNVDLFVEDIFERTQKKHGYEIFSGNYKPPKKETPESDLLLKSKEEIILIENKNKYLTNLSFSGSDSDILKDFVLSFAFSQKQLLKHERNIRIHKKIKFTKGKRELVYEDQNIVKISVSTNNWFSLMTNDTRMIISSLIRLRFNVEEGSVYGNKDEFIKANKYLDDLECVVDELRVRGFDMGVILNQTLFLPLELIVDKYKDDDFIACLKTLVGTMVNTDNILNIYDYVQYLNSYIAPPPKST